jgi:hypothetical protein
VYLRECLLENVGPLEFVDLSLPFNEDGTPKPVVLVGQNGSGKSILLSHVVDALIEFAKSAYRDILVGQESLVNPYFKIVGGTNQRTGASFGVALLRFSDSESAHCYVDKTGVLNPTDYVEKMGDRFASVGSWPVEGNHKAAPIPEDFSRRFFRESSVCYFPSARHERPHWLNPEGVKDEPIFYFAENYADRLYKPVIVESAAQENKQWLLDVMLDSRAEVQPVVVGNPPELSFQILGSTQDLLSLHASRTNVQTLLRSVLQDDSARLIVNYRTVSPYRVSIWKDSGFVPSLDHLSSGQANLFNLFVTVIRYADRGDIRKSFTLPEISGIVLVDEIEAHAHSDLQYEVLPKLIKLFPKVQFILTSHSPLFLLGMEKEYGNEGFQIIDMPSGQTISTERFSEFERSWEYYRRTAAYEQDLEEALRAGSKPLVLTEGETDPKYIKAALELLERRDLLDAVDVEWVGTQGPQGPLNTGQKGLDHTRNVLGSNPGLTPNKVLLLYDCDSNKPPEDAGQISVRSLPRNESNAKVKKGIENLLPAELFESRFYPSRTIVGEYGELKKIEEFDKAGFCRWVCEERRQADDFERFSSVVEILEEFLSITVSEPSAL